MGRDYEMLHAKLHIEKALLLQWAHRVCLLEEEHDRQLNNPTTFSAVEQILAGIQLLLSESSRLQGRYGLQPRPSDKPYPPIEKRVARISRVRMETFVEKFNTLQVRSDETQKSTSASTKIRWVVVDKDKFEKLIQELSHFVSRLHQLFPARDNEQQRDLNILKVMAKEDLEDIHDVKTLRLIRDATSDRHDLMAEAAEERYAAVCQQNVLTILWFRSMDDRRDAVVQAHSRTFEWALKPPHDDVEWDDLSEWLQVGSGTYWISGKAGSGKSTLMKYLYTHDKTIGLLQEWAGSLELTVGSFFFWSLGTEEQQSQDGLSRAILYHILDATPSLVPVLLPRLWRETLEGQGRSSDPLSPPSAAELAAAFEAFGKQSHLQRKIFFFIDGLDEFSGNYLDGVLFVKQLAQSQGTKVLVSSRPIPLCVDAFSSGPKLRLQDLTKTDITSFVHSTVGAHPYMESLHSADSSDGVDPQIILQQLIDKAAGVSSLRVAYDNIQELFRRVDDLPPELEELFQHMLEKIEPRYHEQMAKILRVCYQKQIASGNRGDEVSVYTLALANLDEYAMDCEKISSLKTLTPPKQKARCESMEGRLRSRCGGLLEVRQRKVCLAEACLCGSNAHDPLIHSTVGFMHRTVFEFLDQPATWALPLLRIADDKFNANAALSVMDLQLARMVHQKKSKQPSFRKFITDAIICARLCDAEAPDIAFTILPRLEEIAHLMLQARSNASHSSEQLTSSSSNRKAVAMLVAIESGMVNCAEYYLRTSDLGILQFPLLYHAIRKPAFWREFRLQTNQAMMRCLLSHGCLPNESFRNQEGLLTTPWRDWLRELHRLDSNAFFSAVAVTEEFIKGGADLEPPRMEPVDAILQRHLNGTQSSTAEGRERLRKGTQLSDLIKERMETLELDAAAQNNRDSLVSSTSMDTEGGPTARKRSLSVDKDDSLQSNVKVMKVSHRT
ncbi:hypothetical protein QQX98_002693 [Neonectria punicea]|uniref:NACHT domain-containing protein n=1 Tax=Neonectria punicea TaxID=979145 RepID=A0ABR1HH25_9HYPO